MRVERFYWLAVWTWAIAVIATHLLGAGPLGPGLWGADLYGFLPRIALPLASALLAAGLLLASRPSGRFDRALLSLAGAAGPPNFASRFRAAIAVAASCLVFWIFREGHTLLGDGSPLTRSLPLGQKFHPYQPVTFLIHHWFYSLAHGLFRAEGGDPREIARGTVALSSVLAGTLFVPTAWGLASEMGRTLQSDPADTPAPTWRSVVPLVFLVLLAQGYVQLFFGYVENYTFHALVVGLYLLFSLRCLRGAAPLALPGMALVLDVGLDLSAVLLVPSFLVLVIASFTTAGRRRAAVRDLIVVGLFGAGITALVASVQPGYNFASAAYGIVLQALLAHGDRAQSLAYMFSRAHVRDFMNEQMLIGPAGSYLFAAGVVWAFLARARPTAAGLFFLAAGLVSLGGAWAATDLGLGYPRDWDLFAPSGLVFTAAGLHAVLSGSWRGTPIRRWLFLVACVSLFHTVPWIAVNASFDRSFARFKTLPLGLGRTESAVGAHYLSRGDTAQAIPWFQRSLAAYPANNVAAYRLGQISMRRGMYREAARAFSIALQSRPDRENYRFALVDAIVRGGGRPEWVRPHLDTLLTRNPQEPAYWAAYGVICLGLGERDRATSAFERARHLAPADSTFFATLLLRVHQPDGYLIAIRNDWPGIAGE